MKRDFDLKRIAGMLGHIERVPEVIRCISKSKQWNKIVPAYLGLGRVAFPLEFITPHGDVIVMENLHDLITIWVVFFRNEYPVSSSSMSIIDAGANIGSFSLLAARAAPGSMIIALEPFPATRSRLEAHVVRNGLEHRVACRPWALSSSDGQGFMADIVVPSQSRGLSDVGTEETGIAVETVTLATLLDREGVEQVDLLKMDIEGAEHEVLLSAPDRVLERIRAIALEYHPNRPKAPLFGRLTRVGFRPVTDIGDPKGSDGGVAYFSK